MSENSINRRRFVGTATAAAGGLVTGSLTPVEAKKPPRRSILNFNEKMEYRPMGRTGIMVSAVCMGGHWKRVDTMVPGSIPNKNWLKLDINNSEFLKNRHDVVSRCIDAGINYIDACTIEEVLTYGRVLKGRRDKMYLGFSWYQREPRNKEYRTVPKLMETLDNGLRDSGIDYADVWRLTLPQDGLPDLAELQRIEEAMVGVLEKAKKAGKIRFGGLSTHHRAWLKSMIETYPKQVEVVCTPYTASSKELPGDSVFAAIRKHKVAVFGIKPFADNSLFKGDSSLNSPYREEDDRRARLAIRYILGNPAITAPIPGLVNTQQVDNVALAVTERRELDEKERAELEQIGTEMWANLRPGYEWLRNWEYV